MPRVTLSMSPCPASSQGHGEATSLLDPLGLVGMESFCLPVYQAAFQSKDILGSHSSNNPPSRTRLLMTPILVLSHYVCSLSHPLAWFLLWNGSCSA